jgi:hypothetical protein
MVLELAALHLHDTADLAADGLHLARWAVLGHGVPPEMLEISGWVTESVTVSVAVNAAWQLKNWHKTSDWYPLVI